MVIAIVITILGWIRMLSPSLYMQIKVNPIGGERNKDIQLVVHHIRRTYKIKYV